MSYQRKDAHYLRAKSAGYRARSAYKLLELDDRLALLRPGARVADLGAWPGGWLQVATDRVGERGRIVGVDLVEIEPFAATPITCLVADLRDADTAGRIIEALGSLADVVLSDAAPKLTGIRATDEARCEEVSDAVVDLLPELLVPGGSLLMKVFMGPGQQPLIKRLRARFGTAKTIRSGASRQGSSELYVIARDHRPGVPCG